MTIPIGTDRPQRIRPWMNILIIVANVVVYGLSHLSQHDPRGQPLAGLPTPDWNIYMLDPRHPHLYQFITYQFLHAGLAHIGFNMLFLYVFGNNLNEKLGHLGYLFFYLAGGVLAGCGQLITSGPRTGATLGASGAISAVTGLFLILLPQTHIRIFVIYFYRIWEIPSMYFILFKVGQDVFEQFAGSSGVAYMAHISGTLAGVLIGILLLATRLVQRDHYDMLAMINRYRRRKEYHAIVARGYDPFAPAPARGVNEAAQRGKVNALSNADPRIDSLRAEISRLVRLHDIQTATARYLELRALDATQVLPPQEQVDVAAQLMSTGQYAQAAGAYEDYLRIYPSSGVGQQDQIMLMLGLIYARYHPNHARARELLQTVLPNLHQPAEKDLAAAELEQLNASTPPPPSTPQR